MTLSFTLSMPGRNSWNGLWSGEETLYAIVKSLGTTNKAKSKGQAILDQRYFSHNFGDGWRASIEVKEVTPSEARQIRKKSLGFCGYDWMVNNILSHGSASDKKEVVVV